MRKFFNRLYFLLSGILLVIMVFSLTACSSTKTLEPAPEGYSFIKPPSEEQIYSRFGNSKMYMTTDPEQIADWYCDFVVIGKFLGNTDTFVANGDHIYTKGLFEVTDVLKGDYAGQYLSLIHISSCGFLEDTVGTLTIWERCSTARLYSMPAASPGVFFPSPGLNSAARTSTTASSTAAAQASANRTHSMAYTFPFL